MTHSKTECLSEFVEWMKKNRRLNFPCKQWAKTIFYRHKKPKEMELVKFKRHEEKRLYLTNWSLFGFFFVLCMRWLCLRCFVDFAPTQNSCNMHVNADFFLFICRSLAAISLCVRDFLLSAPPAHLLTDFYFVQMISKFIEVQK